MSARIPAIYFVVKLFCIFKSGEPQLSLHHPIKAVRWCRVERGWYFYMGDN